MMQLANQQLKSLTAAASLVACSAALAQQPIYSNASSDVSTPALNAVAFTLSGVPAPAGGLWSEVSSLSAAESNALAGVSGQAFGSVGAFRYADDFVVPFNRSWQIQSVSLYAYQPGAMSAPFSAVDVRLWRGRPGDAGSSVIWGDTFTNRLATSVGTNIYRVFNTQVPPLTLPDTTRFIWQLDTNVGVTLQQGTYWLDWQVTSANPLGEAFCPTATLPGVRTQGGWNAVQFKPGTPLNLNGVWTTITDPGKPSSAIDQNQALPFILVGLIGCAGDVNGDGVVNVTDIFAFLSAWFAQQGQSGGLHTADANNDGLVDVADIFAFLAEWFVPCP